MDGVRYRRARERARALRGFYTHLIGFVAVNAILAIVNLLTNPRELWFYWVTVFWGIGLVFHAIDTFTIRGRVLSDEWEERKAHEIMEDEERKKAG